jgi:hypothetical protein
VAMVLGMVVVLGALGLGVLVGEVLWRVCEWWRGPDVR